MITYETLKSFCANEKDLRPAMTYACKREDGWWASDSYRIICVPESECQQGDTRFLCDELPESLRFPNVENVVDVKGFKPKFAINVKSIKNAIAQLLLIDEYEDVRKEINYIECPQCDGGSIELTESIHYKNEWYKACATAECPICHGHGVIPDFDDYDPDEDDYNPKRDKTYIAEAKTGRKVPDFKNTVFHLAGNGYIRASHANDLLRIAKEQQVEEIECAGGNYENCILFRIHGVIIGLMPIINKDGGFTSVEIKTEI